MSRLLRVLSCATLLATVSSTALAAKPMAASAWGVGPKIGTTFIPGHMPMSFPSEVEDDTVKGEPAIQGVRGDVLFGIDAVYYAGDAWRLGLTGAIDVGKRYSDTTLIAHYDQAVASFEGMDILAGGGVGFGSMRWRGEKEAKLAVPHYPVRAQVGAIFHRKLAGVQGSVFTQYNIPANHYYTNAAGQELDDVSAGTYLQFGFDITAYFGDLF
jgi:hypothetical protein